jgi:hypothetical protein
MPVIVVTRLRLRDPALLDEFFTDAVAAIEQATKSEGNLGADALADADNAWWSVSAWQERRLMQAYVDSQPHLGISARLDHYCDEATFVDWDQASPDLPDWQTSWRHLTADGQAARLTHPSTANQTRDFPPPVQPPPSGLRAAAHPFGQGVAADAMLVAEFAKLLAIDLLGQIPQRIVSGLREAQVTQGVNYPLPAVRHRHHLTRLVAEDGPSLTRRRP